MSDWAVGLEQRRPFEYHQVEVFTEELDALDYADKYARGHGYVQLSRRTWRSAHDDGQRLTVRKR